ncbi:MAG: hypothetical protein V1897_05540 [Pseudomonadota bacterium]
MLFRVIARNYTLSDVLDRREQIRLTDLGVNFNHVSVILTIFRGIFTAITWADIHFMDAKFAHAFLDHAFLS